MWTLTLVWTNSNPLCNIVRKYQSLTFGVMIHWEWTGGSGWVLFLVSQTWAILQLNGWMIQFYSDQHWGNSLKDSTDRCIISFKRKYGYKLSSLYLNKMISVSFSTLAVIKTYCQSLRELEIYVYEVTSGSTLPLDQAIVEAPASKLEHLVSLQLGGNIPSGE